MLLVTESLGDDNVQENEPDGISSNHLAVRFSDWVQFIFYTYLIKFNTYHSDSKGKWLKRIVDWQWIEKMWQKNTKIFYNSL